MAVHLFLWSLLVATSFAYADSAIDRASFSDLVASELTYSVDENLDELENNLWQKYVLVAQADQERKRQHDRRSLRVGDKTMRFSLEKKGSPTNTGYPVYIALHGGGSAPSSLNESQWNHMKIYYRDSVDNGIYIAPRGISDTWDLHFQNESYPLYDRLIENLIAYEGADPNRIYLLGFSAGGDGVYQVVPRMPDRFAAANMSAGHHNWIAFDNLLNTPLLLQVGERDAAYNRHRVAAENSLALDALQKLHGGYIHDVFIHYQAGHNGWYDNDSSSAAHEIILDPRAWLNSNDRRHVARNTNAVDWLNNYRRITLPTKLIWDLSTRSPRGKTWGAHYIDVNFTSSATRDLFYWLALDIADVNAGRIEAFVNTDDNAVYFTKLEGVSNVRILLNKDLFDFSRSVVVYYNNQKITEITPRVKLNVMAKSLLERGDPSMLFHDEVVINFPKLLSPVPVENSFSYCSDGDCRLASPDDFFRSRRFPLDLRYHCQQDNHYALTFDDGPSANVPRVLEILARHNVPATFFLVGGNLDSDEGKQRAQQINAAGHEIANHTRSHASLISLNREQIIAELMSTQRSILDAIGDTPSTRRASSIVRPPYGNINHEVQSIINELGFTSVRWNSDRYDWRLHVNQSNVVHERVVQHLNFIRDRASSHQRYNRSIIDVNHDHSDATVSALDEIIPLLQNAGYQLVPISECLSISISSRRS